MIACACGCGGAIEPVDSHGRPRRFLRGHNGRRPMRERFRDHVEVDAATGCWLWQGAIDWRGYPVITISDQRGHHTEKAHRVSYETFVGPIPDGLHLDHLCRVKHCVRPDHLEPVTEAENKRRVPPEVWASRPQNQRSRAQ